MSDIKVYAFDVDGTLTVPHKWVNDPSNKHLLKVPPNLPMVDLAKFYQNTPGNIIAIATARGESLREPTEEWLRTQGIKADTVLMRGLGDNRPDPDLKVDEIAKLMKTYGKVEIFYDDKPENCDAVRKRFGIKSICVRMP